MSSRATARAGREAACSLRALAAALRTSHSSLTHSIRDICCAGWQRSLLEIALPILTGANQASHRKESVGYAIPFSDRNCMQFECCCNVASPMWGPNASTHLACLVTPLKSELRVIDTRRDASAAAAS